MTTTVPAGASSAASPAAGALPMWRGSANANVLPSPGVLVIQIRPPWSSTI